MSTAAAASLSSHRVPTAEDLIALPDDGVERELIGGELRELPITRRNKVHSGVEATIVKLLGYWHDRQPEPRGRIHSGEAGFRIRREPETFVGIDVAYVSPELLAADDPDKPFYDGAPVLAVEVLSPSDTHGALVEKINAYLDAGVVVWVVDPDFRTVRIHRPGEEPVMLNVSQDLPADPYLPGFRAPLATFFE